MRTFVRMSLSGLHHAIRAKEADRALEIASRLRFVPLRYEARLVVLLAETKHPFYNSTADRFLIRMIEEVGLPMIETKKLADALAHVHHHFYGYDAQLQLGKLAGNLHRIATREFQLAFDSEGVRW